MVLKNQSPPNGEAMHDHDHEELIAEMRREPPDMATTASVSAQMDESACQQKAVDDLFEKHGPAPILFALAQRCKAESAIAQGEGQFDEDKSRERQWAQLATELEEVETPVKG